MKAIILAVVLLVACGGREPLAVKVTMAKGPEWTRSPELTEQVTTYADAITRAWDGDPSVLDGGAIYFDAQVVDPDSGLLQLGHCYPGSEIHLEVLRESPCPLASALAHEVGHAVIGDPGHEDPRWHDAAFWSSMAAALAAVVPAEDAQCLAYLQGETSAITFMNLNWLPAGSP